MDNILEKKIEVASTVTVGSKQLKTTSTHSNVGIMTHQEYVQKMGTELLTNVQVLSILKVAFNDFSSTETATLLQDKRAEQFSINSVDKNKLSFDVAALETQLNSCIVAIENDMRSPF